MFIFYLDIKYLNYFLNKFYLIYVTLYISVDFTVFVG